MTPELIVHLEDVSVTVREKEILRIDQLEILRGEQVAIIGASGAGKTTLMRLIKGFVKPVRGKVEVLGETLPIANRSRQRRFHRMIGAIHQHFDLIGRESVWRNVIHGRLGFNPLWRSVLGTYRDPDLRICLNAIREVHLEDKMDRDTRTLSGGEQQRVAIARALAQEPEIMLADEPVSNLDPFLTRSILDLLVAVSRAHRLTLLMNLHLPDLARRYGRRVIALRQGRILWDLPCEDVSPERIGEVYQREPSQEAVDVKLEGTTSAALGWTLGRLDRPVRDV